MARATAKLEAKITLRDAAYTLLGQYRSLFVQHSVAVRDSSDVEAIHQMRVNARRMRAILRAFASILPRGVRALEVELRWIASSLGKVRDMDVQIERLQGPKLKPVRQKLAQVRAQHEAAMQADLASTRYAALVSGLDRAISSRRVSSSISKSPLGVAAPDVIAAAMRPFKRGGDKIDSQSEPEQYHALRKKAKRVRYTCEALADLYGKPAKRFLASFRDFQELVGAHQDAIIAQALFGGEAALISDESLAKTLAEEAAAAASKLRKEFPTHYGRTVKCWRQLRKAMDRERRSLWKG